ncbi:MULTISPECIES: bifunctional ADP-dependent NAD(P)H-hydrate dehydratase/NAD(P)H-hydrate epimerase [Paracoccus]|nr:MULTISPECIES: bifunctional ADP-dependent NAD(P)H-hydrate dehydratase/NAD(P)H-hydrate epimerase [Paracoccus]SMG45140.1 yjeF C-terminal region, hydroxyethylthiazole kinase-related/yjeF N-terminal region [Paracoccus sp. J56]
MCDRMAGRREILTTRQMRALEGTAINSASVTGAALMERAGAGVVTEVLTFWPEYAQQPGRAVILCGPGNNGGDGYVIARQLASCGWQIRLAALAPPVTPDARAAAAGWIGTVAALDDIGPEDFPPGTLCIDALFGTGLTRPLPDECAAPLRLAAACGCPIVAVDILSGLCADSGRVLGGLDLPAVALTVSFQRARLGHLLAQGGELSGALRLVDIGLDSWMKGVDGPALLAGPQPALAKRAGHKYDHGHALILGGGSGQGGAARLTARAALRVGAGLVTLACPPDALAENAARLDAVMLRPVPDRAGLERLLEDRRFNALALGPALGLQRARDLVPVALASQRAVLLDADALTAFADAPGTLFSALHPGVVLTPHGGEFARLFPDLARQLVAPAPTGPAFSRLDAVRQAAARAGCTVLLKGPDTVIATPGGEARIAAAVGEAAAPWLATAGSGDVLSGIIAGLLARGFPPLDAAATGAWLHAEAARDFGPGLIAEDLPGRLPSVLRMLGC